MKKVLLLFLALGLAVGLVGCGGGGDDDPVSYNVTGNWVGTVQFNNTTYTVTMSIVQTNVSLSAQTTSDSVLGGGSYNYSGSISGSSVYLLSTSGREYNLTLTAATAMSGTYESGGTPSPATFSKT